ncbi:MAG TPA: BrnA antitoxin family protein [Vicinamibacterales bacterium]|nr:BrnA antitoxin family protein [Vicinamibacterales bacterium]
MPKRSVSSARGARVAGSARSATRKIDFSDIPDSSPAQLKAMRRVGRPPLGYEPRQLIAIRVDPGVLDQFRKEARRRRVGYQTLINEVLAQHVRKDVA